MRLIDVLSKDSCCQTVFGVIGPFHHLLQRLELQDLHHWAENLRQKMEEIQGQLMACPSQPEWPPPGGPTVSALSYLLPGNGHVVLHISKHSGLDEVSLVGGHSSSTHQLGSLPFPCADVAQDLVELLQVHLDVTTERMRTDSTSLEALGGCYLRPLLRLQVEGVSNQSPLGSLYAPLHKLLVDVFLHVSARASAAALALVEEQGKVGLFHSVLHWGGAANQT